MRVVVGLGLGMAAGIGLLAIEAALASRGEREAFTNPDRRAVTLGSGPPLSYVVMGDSTAAGQGAPPADGIAPLTARHLATTRTVTLTNTGVSGAVTGDLRDDQLPAALAAKPDLVLIAAGANDVTHFVRTGTVRANLGEVIDGLVAANCQVKIVLTGSPDFGGVRRFAQPLRAVAGGRGMQITRGVEKLVADRQLTFAPIARETGPAFRRDPGLLADDRFHPNARGYALWVETLDRANAEALATQPAHCGPPATGRT